MRLNFSEQTALTLSYLGGQSGDDYTGDDPRLDDAADQLATFAPPAGLQRFLPAGISIPFDTQANTNYTEYLQQNLFQAELRWASARRRCSLARTRDRQHARGGGHSRRSR